VSAPLVDVSVLRWLPAEVPVDGGAVREGLARLLARVPGATVSLAEADVSPDGSQVELAVGSVAELSVWYDAFSRATASSTGRCERRLGGQLYALGGLRWRVSLPALVELPGVRVLLVADSGEFERLPRTRLVRALCPDLPRLWAIEDREAAAAATEVAA
jgi:hypothetical protein